MSETVADDYRKLEALHCHFKLRIEFDGVLFLYLIITNTIPLFKHDNVSSLQLVGSCVIIKKYINYSGILKYLMKILKYPKRS